MKKVIAIAAVLAMVLSLAACTVSSLEMNADDAGIHVVAKNGSDGSGTDSITIDEGYGLCINHTVTSGSFHVKATDESGAVVFEKDLTDNIADMVPATGKIDVTIEAKGADGTVDIIAYDVAAQAQADATFDESNLPEGMTREDVGMGSSSAASIANPWTDVKTADEATEGAGMGNFGLPKDGTETDAGELHWYNFRYMEWLAEANGSVGAADLTVRKGVKNPAEPVSYDTADVSGDYTEYAHTWEVDSEFWKVKCFGNEEGKMMKAIWTSDNFSYSIVVRGQGDIHDTYGLDKDVTAALVNAID